jgi:hypothetical protein
MYKAMIVKATGCAEHEAEEVEEIMRHEVFHSTLDWQTKAQFNKGAREAYQVLQLMRDVQR